MRVLVVEDEQNLREQICSALRKKGYTVDEAGDGEEGLYCGPRVGPIQPDSQ